MKFAKLAELILIVKLGKVIGQFVGVKKIILVTHSKDVEENANLVETAQHNKNAFSSDVWQLVAKELVEKMLIAKPETIEHSANVPQISWEIQIPDAIPNVQDMTNAQLPKLVLDLVVKIHAENPIQMSVVPEQLRSEKSQTYLFMSQRFHWRSIRIL